MAIKITAGTGPTEGAAPVDAEPNVDEQQPVKGHDRVVADGAEPHEHASNEVAAERVRNLNEIVATIRDSVRAGSEKDLLARLAALSGAVDRAAPGIQPLGHTPPSDEPVELSAADIESAKAAMREALGAFGSVMFEDSIENVDAREVRNLGFRMATFSTELEAAAGDVDELQALGQRYRGQWLPDQSHTLLLAAFDKADAWDELVTYYEGTISAQPTYASNELGRELCIVARNKSAEALPKLAKKARAAAQKQSGRDKQHNLRKADTLDASFAPAVAVAVSEALRYVHELAEKDLGTIGDFSPNTENVRTAPHLNGEVLAGLGKSFRLVADGAWNEEIRALVEQEWAKAGLEPAHAPGSFPADFDYRHAALVLSTQFYEAGFVRDFEYYPGINAVYNNYRLADDARTAGNDTEADWYAHRADQMAELVAASTERAGGIYAKDYWCLATQTELAVINGDADTFAQSFPVMVERAKAPWEVNATLSQMRALAQRRGPNHPSAPLAQLAIAKLEELVGKDGWSGKLGEFDAAAPAAKKAGTYEQLEQDLDDWKAGQLAVWSREIDRLRSASGRDPLLAVRQELTRQLNSNMTSLAIFNTSHTSGGVVQQMVGGNFAFGGQITNMTATRETFRLLRPVWAERLGLAHERDLDEVDRVVDDHLQTHFGLVDSNGHRPLEHLHDPEHTKILDPYQRNRFQWAGVPQGGDDRCDLAVIYASGTGDCRDVGNVKGAMVTGQFMDVDHEIMMQAFDAGVGHLSAGPKQALASADFDHAMTELGGRLKVDYGIMDVTVYAPVENDGLYQWKTDDQGHVIPKADGTFDPIENHRFTIRKVFADDGTIERLEIRDAFYKEIFGFEKIIVERDQLQDFLHPEGFPAGFMGLKTPDGKRVPIKIAPTGWSGKGVVETTVTDLLYLGKPVALSADSLLNGTDRIRALAHQIATLKLGEDKAALLVPFLTEKAGFEDVTAQAHEFWYGAQQVALANDRDPFAGWASELVTAKDVRGLSKEALSKELNAQLSDAKYETITRAADAAVVADPRFKPIEELRANATIGLEGMVAAGSAALPATALLHYLADWRPGEDATHVLRRLAQGHPATTEDFARFLHIVQVAAAHVGGQRGIDTELPRVSAAGSASRKGRDDFVPFCELSDDQKGLDWEYGAKPNIEYLRTLMEGRTGDAEAFLRDVVRGVYGDETAAYQHNVGWKASKDKALADPNNPFLGWAKTRIKVTPETQAAAAKGKDALATALGIDAARVTDAKLAAIQSADGGDIVHPLFKEYHETLQDHADGGLRIGGQNEAPVGVVANYLLSFRRDDIRTMDELRHVIDGLLDGTDLEGSEDLPRLIHAAFEAEQLVWGDRPFDTEAAAVTATGSTHEVSANSRFRPAETGDGALERDAAAARRAVAKVIKA